MLDLAFIRENADKVKQGAKNKNLNPQVVDEVLRLDERRRQLLVSVEQLRAKRNELNEQLKSGRTDELIAESKNLKQQLQDLEPELKQVEAALQAMLLQVPNVPADDVPVGMDDSGNVQVSAWGEKPKLNFEAKDHIQLGLDLDLLDLDRGSKVAGYRGYYLKNQAVMMQFGLMRFAMDLLMQHGFTPMIAPIVNRKEAFVNSGHFPWGQAEAYAMMPEDPDKVNTWGEMATNYNKAELDFASDYYLAGTAEVPLVSYHAGEVLNEKDLPLRYVGFSPCYRREIGNYGKDTRGIYRVHEFMKIEQVILCANDWEESKKWHENLRSYAEEILQKLGLHYRVLLMCTGDMGEPQVKKYDIETWMPGRQTYGETMSDSIMGEFQSRRANIRYRAKDGTIKYAHMLNNTAVASSRMLIALWENYQQADGSIAIPEALQPYVGFDKITARK